MRIRIIFKLRNKGATLPFQHQHLLLNLVENMLKDKLKAYAASIGYKDIRGEKSKLKSEEE